MPRYPADGKIYNVEAGLLTYSARRLPNCRTISGKECRFTHICTKLHLCNATLHHLGQELTAAGTVSDLHRIPF